MGSVAEVTVQMMSASATACCTVMAAVIGMPSSTCIFVARAWARSCERPQMVMDSSARTLAMARTCVAACSPVPRMARCFASLRASASVATALAAAVRMAVTSPAWTTQTGVPVSGSKSTMRPWCDWRPCAAFSGKMLMSFAPKGALAPSAPGMMPKRWPSGERDDGAQELLGFAGGEGDHRVAHERDADLVGEAAAYFFAVDEAHRRVAMDCDAAILVDPEANPVGPVVPVYAIATLRDGATYGGTGPVRRDLTAAEVAGRALP